VNVAERGLFLLHSTHQRRGQVIWLQGYVKSANNPLFTNQSGVHQQESLRTPTFASCVLPPISKKTPLIYRTRYLLVHNFVGQETSVTRKTERTQQRSSVRPDAGNINSSTQHPELQ